MFEQDQNDNVNSEGRPLQGSDSAKLARKLILKHHYKGEEDDNFSKFDEQQRGLQEMLSKKSPTKKGAEVVVPPIKINSQILSWKQELHRQSKSLLNSRPYGKFGVLTPKLFRDNNGLGLVFLQTKGGVGKTTHALNFAATLAVDGAEFYLQSGLWEVGQQTGLRPFVDLEQCLDSSSRHLDVGGLPIDADKMMQIVFAPEHYDDTLRADEFLEMTKFLRRRFHLLTVDMGYFDIYNQGELGYKLDILLQTMDTQIIIPWTGNIAAWNEARALGQLLQEAGLSANKLWGIEIFDKNNRKLYPSEAEKGAMFGDQILQIPYVPRALEEAFAVHSIPILYDTNLRNGYKLALEKMLAHWTKGQK